MTARKIGFLTILVLALAIAGLIFGLRSSTAQSPALPAHASGSWPMYQLDATHNAVLAGPQLHANFQAALGDRINAGFAYDNGVIYATSFDHRLYAVDATTGKIRWYTLADDVLMSTPVFSKGTIVIGSGHNGFLKPKDADSQTWGRPGGNTVYGFSLDGKPLWKFHTDGEDMPSPAIDGDTVVFANGDGHTYALDLTTGKLKWKTALSGVATMASAAIDDGMVFVSSCHNAPYFCETRALDLQTGKTIWTNPNGGSDCAPAVSGGLVFVNTNRDDPRFHTGGVDVVAALDEHTGQTHWTWESEPGPYTFPATNERQIAGTVAGGVLYQPIGNASRLVAFDATTGKVLWNLRTWADVKMSPVVTTDRLYFGDVGGVLYAVDRRTGEVLSTNSFLQPFSAAPPLIVGDTIFVAVGQVIVAMPLSGI